MICTYCSGLVLWDVAHSETTCQRCLAKNSQRIDPHTDEIEDENERKSY
jgi:hypothetical protein